MAKSEWGVDQAEIDAWRDAHWDEVLADIQELVQVESVEDLSAAAPGAPYGPGPREALDRALAIAARYGLDAHDCEGHIGYADLPGESAAQIGIIGHVDVVPAGPGWSVEPFDVTARDGYLLGRGVIDDKGPLVVALHAVRFWAERAAARGQRLPYTVRVLFGANEETNMKDVEYYRAHYDDPAFLFTPDNQFPVGYGESGICSGTLTSAPLLNGEILELQGGQAVNAVPGEAHAAISTRRISSAHLQAKAATWNATPAPSSAASASAPAAPAPGTVEVVANADGTATVWAYGVSAHASTPDQGVNAIGVLVNFLLDAGVGTPQERAFLQLMSLLHADSSGAQVGIAATDQHFGALTMVGGVATLADGRITQSLDFRYPTSTTAAAIEQHIRQVAADATAVAIRQCVQQMANPDTDTVTARPVDAPAATAPAVANAGTSTTATFTMEHDKRPFLMDPDSAAVRALLDAYCAVTGEAAQGMTSKGGTYARCFTTGVSFGVEKPWELAPAWVGGMHGPDEGVSEALLRQSFSIYARAVGNLMQVQL